MKLSMVLRLDKCLHCVRRVDLGEYIWLELPCWRSVLDSQASE
jgi:hypothetical protein